MAGGMPGIAQLTSLPCSIGGTPVLNQESLRLPAGLTVLESSLFCNIIYGLGSKDKSHVANELSVGGS